MANIKDSQMIENIKNYENEISSLETFVEAVRKLPGMYLTGIGNRGFIGMFREILQNVFDELNRAAHGKSPCNYIKVYFEEGTNICGISDNGRGIPFNKIIDIYSKEHTSSNYEKEPGDYSAGRNGVGAKITNALSQWFIVVSYILGEARKVEFLDGIPSPNGVEVVKNKDNKQGTEISFQPSYDVMGSITVTVEDVLNLLELLFPLTPIGSTLEFSGTQLSGEKIKRKIVSEDGLVTYLNRMTVTPLVKPIMYGYDNGTMKAEVAFTYDSTNLQEEQLLAFGNYCYTSTGTHMKGFLDGISKYFRDYMNKIYLGGGNVNSLKATAKKKKTSKITVIDTDIKTGLKASISVAHLYPQFIGQDKDEFANEDMYGFIRNLTIDYLDQWSKNNPSDLQKLCKYFKEVAELRLKEEEGKEKLSNKYKASAFSSLPGKFIKPSGKEDLEFIICEGDSALGSAKNSRCKIRQGIFPIRGKLPNAFTTTKQAFLDNDEVQGIIAIVNGGYGKNFDLSRVPWQKVIFMADADKDGCHIDNLLLKLFLMYMRPMIEDGRVYRAVPPLYGAKKGKDKYEYFTTRLDFVRYNLKMFLKNNMIISDKKKTFTELQLVEIFFKNIDYIYELERVANRYAINPELLELICFNLYNNSFANVIRKAYRFINIEKKNNTTIITGLANDRYQTIFINDKFIADLKDVLDIIEQNDSKYYHVNNNLVSLYQLMKLFNSSAPNVNRYKGLGEMNSLQLADSTLHPDSDRTLKRYTLDDAVSEIESIRYLESNRFDLIKDAKVSRIDILG